MAVTQARSMLLVVATLFAQVVESFSVLASAFFSVRVFFAWPVLSGVVPRRSPCWRFRTAAVGLLVDEVVARNAGQQMIRWSYTTCSGGWLSTARHRSPAWMPMKIATAPRTLWPREPTAGHVVP